jgi:hypothetical protein
MAVFSAACGTPAARPDAAVDAQAMADLEIERAPECPARTPEPASHCIAPAQVCDFGASSCRCTDDHQWECYADAESCPITRPESRASCGAGVGACWYDHGFRCVCQWGIWQCDDDKRPCPAALPPDGATCDAIPLDTCLYGDSICSCMNNVWRCAHPDPRCPFTRPSSDCSDADLVCAYGVKAICHCSFNDALWLCVNS